MSSVVDINYIRTNRGNWVTYYGVTVRAVLMINYNSRLSYAICDRNGVAADETFASKPLLLSSVFRYSYCFRFHVLQSSD